MIKFDVDGQPSKNIQRIPLPSEINTLPTAAIATALIDRIPGHLRNSPRTSLSHNATVSVSTTVNAPASPQSPGHT